MLRQLGRLAVAVALVAAVFMPASSAGATSPLWNSLYPAPAGCIQNDGLYACLHSEFQIDGSGLFVQIFYRTTYDATAINATVYTRMCGPTFGCAWTAHAMEPGETLNLTISEYRDMPAGQYQSWIELAGYGPVYGGWNVE